MKLHVVGCSHHQSSIETRERLAFNREQVRDALSLLRRRYPESEAVLLSTCNRVELYCAAEQDDRCPTHRDVANFLAEFHGLDAVQVFNELFERSGEDAVRHLFAVAASLDSMVVGEAQILSQVKQAYEQATAGHATGPLTHSVFQAAMRVAKRVATDTAINQKRVSIPSVAVADFAKQLFERFDDKKVLVIGAGEMGKETLRYLIEEGAVDITVVNRDRERAERLAREVAGHAVPWEQLHALLVAADLIISTTGSSEPIVKAESFGQVVHERAQRTLFVLDLAVPRDFEPRIGEFAGVYLYSIDDLRLACDANRGEREKEWPKAQRIIDDETTQFMIELNHRATAPTIRRLKAQANEIKLDELSRLFNKLSSLDHRSRTEIERAFDRLVNKLLHPPLESLRDEAGHGTTEGLLEALRRLFQIRD
jgi:glutamyl-tRNA reductase